MQALPFPGTIAIPLDSETRIRPTTRVRYNPTGKTLVFAGTTEADRLMKAAQREMDDAERLELYSKLHRLFVKDPPADFL